MMEEDRYRAAWKARRQRTWILSAVLVVLMVILTRVDPLTGALCIAGMLAAIWWFYRFRCPRCGEIFFSDWKRFLGGVPREPLKCQHCGLALNEIPGEKPS